MEDRNYRRRRTVLKTSGATLAALSGASLLGTASACPGCGGSSGGAPTVTTDWATVSGSEVTTQGTVGDLGDDSSADAWFDWGPEGDGLPYDACLHTVYSDFTAFCDGYDSACSMNTYGTLSSGTYEYRAVAANDYGSSTGQIKTFTI